MVDKNIGDETGSEDPPIMEQEYPWSNYISGLEPGDRFLVITPSHDHPGKHRTFWLERGRTPEIISSSIGGDEPPSPEKIKEIVQTGHSRNVER